MCPSKRKALVSIVIALGAIFDLGLMTSKVVTGLPAQFEASWWKFVIVSLVAVFFATNAWFRWNEGVWKIEQRR